MPTQEQIVRSVVEQVLSEIVSGEPSSSNGHADGGDWGVFADAGAAVTAAKAAFAELSKRPLADREKVVQIVKTLCDEHAEEWGRKELDETKVGRLDHKVAKLHAISGVPGTEYLKTDARSSDEGICLTEYAPFGVIAAITPVTHSLPTLACNVVNMVAAGNTLVCNPHPSGKRIACEGAQAFNRAIHAATGLKNLCCVIREPTLETADALFTHRDVRMIVVTGGPAVAKAALATNKKAIVAGPGNPPVVVDETADLDVAARSIVYGAAFDNNLLCIGEKEVFVVRDVFEPLMDAFSKHGAVRLSRQQVDTFTTHAFGPPKKPGGHAVLNRDLIGQDPAVLAKSIGLEVPANTQLLVGEATMDNPFVSEEQMMPFVPVVSVVDAEGAMSAAVEMEHGYGHTAIIHSRRTDRITEMGRRANTTLFVANGPSTGALGDGGAGYLSFSIATPTGEGVTTPLTFTRQRQNVVCGSMRIV